MIVLGIESSGNAGGVALLDAGVVLPDAGGDPAGPAALREIRLEMAGSHTERLLPAVDRVLRDAGCDLSGISGIAVSLGPGSFTGLRAGLGLAKGLAYARGIDLAGIPTLEVLASECREAPWILALADARREEVFSALYHRPDGELEERRSTRLGVPEDLVRVLREATGDGEPLFRVVAVAESPESRPWLDPVLEALGRGRLEPLSVERIPASAGAVARLGARRLQAGMKDDPLDLEPLYVRPSDAETKRREKTEK